MKRLTLSTTQKWFTATLAIALLALVSCNNSAEKGTSNSKGKAPATTIQEAAFFGNTEAIKAHIAYGSDLNEKDAYGSTPLHIATLFGKTDAAILLIDAGADLSQTSADGSTALHTAAFFCRTDIVKALLTKGIDVTARNDYGSTALESISAPFTDMKPIYDQMAKDLGPLGLKLDYKQIEATRPTIAELIASSK